LAGLLLFAGVWWINLFNFMDGIDGIAASQAVFMLVAAAVLGVWFHPGVADVSGWLWMLAVAAATLGFLRFNWPPARIFMGDVGSTYLAFMIFALALLSVREGWLTYPVWLVLGAVFVSDASVTLLRRMLAGERWFEAHRSHAYQRLSRRWGSHRRVTLLSISFNLLLLAPLAWTCLAWPRWAWVCVVLTYTPLAAAMLALGAGKQD
jgi:Fuc2NAc and GlcNAc transferase